MNTLHVKKGDTVTILSGEAKGKTGKVLRAFPNRSMVLVEGINMVKRHQRATKEGSKGQIVDKHLPIHVSKVAVSGLKQKKASTKKAAK